MNKAEELIYLGHKKEFARNKEKIVRAKSNDYHLAETCENCGSPEFMEYHHALPLRFLGTNKITNIKRLCKKCHHKLHHGFKTPEKYIKNNPFEGIQLEVLFSEFLHESCDSCKSKHNLKMRMVVPYSVGGQHVKGNLVTFCKSCNTILEKNTDEIGILNHSNLIKIGQKQARLEGIHLGRPAIDKKVNNAIIAHYLLGLTIKEVALAFSYSESTVYKYKRNFDNKYIFEKLDTNEFNLLDKKTGVLKYHFEIENHAA